MAATATFLTTWSFDPVPLIGLLVVAAAYVWGIRRAQARLPGQAWPRRYTASFFAGLALCWLVLLGPIGAYDDTFFWAHMVQHIALMMVIPPLLLLGAPVLLLLRASTPAVRRRWVLPVLHSRTLGFLTRPAVGWLIFAGVLVGTHFSPFYEFALTHPAVHLYVEHPLYLGAGLIYYYPLIGAGPGPVRLSRGLAAASLFGMMFPETMTGFFIYSSSYLLYPYFGQVQRPFGPGPLVDQEFGGALMWGGGMIIDTVWVVLAVLAWLRSERRVAERIDAQTLASLPALPGAP